MEVTEPLRVSTNLLSSPYAYVTKSPHYVVVIFKRVSK